MPPHPIMDDLVREAVKLEDVVPVQLSHALGSYLGSGWDRVYLLREAINHYADGVEAIGLWEFTD